MRISVIMLAFNRETLMKRAIESILNQTLVDFEFILVNNGSTDSSGEICDLYAKKDTRIKVIHKERGNIGSGRNAGLDAAIGKYIAFIDDDDWCEPDFLDFLYRLAEEHAADVSICGTVRDEGGIVTTTRLRDDIVVMDSEQAVITLMWRKLYNTGFPTKLISSRLFENFRFMETGQYDDILLMYKILANAGKVAYHGIPKYHVYRHSGNNSAVTSKDSLITPEYLNAYRNAYQDRSEWLCRKFPHLSDYWRYFNWSFQLSMIHKIISNNIPNCDGHLLEMKKELKKADLVFLNSPHLQDFESDWLRKYIL